MGVEKQEQEGSTQRPTNYDLFVTITLRILNQDIFLSKYDVLTIAGFLGLPPQETADSFQRDILPTGRLGSSLQEEDPEHQIGMMSGEFFHLELGNTTTYNCDRAEEALADVFRNLPAYGMLNHGLSEYNESGALDAQRSIKKQRAEADPPSLPPYLQRVFDAVQKGMGREEIMQALDMPRDRFYVYISMLRKRGYALGVPTDSPTNSHKPHAETNAAVLDNAASLTIRQDSSPASSHEFVDAPRQPSGPLSSPTRRVRIDTPVAPTSGSTEGLGERDQAIIRAYTGNANLAHAQLPSNLTASEIHARIAYLREKGYAIPLIRPRRAVSPADSPHLSPDRGYEPSFPHIDKATDYINEDPDTLSVAELAIWRHVSSGEPLDMVGDILKQQTNRTFTATEIQQIVASLDRKGIYPDAENQLSISERLYGREVADFLQLIVAKSPQLIALFPDFATLQLPHTTNDHVIRKIIAATNHSNTNIRPSLREETTTNGEYHDLLLSKVQHAFQHADRSVWLKVFAVPERVRVDAVNLLDWLHGMYEPPQDASSMQIAV